MSDPTELRAERDRLAALLASLDEDGAARGNPQAQEAERSFLKHRLFVLEGEIIKADEGRAGDPS